MLKAFVRQISKEKDLEPAVIKEAIERAILTASRKNLSQYRDAVANLNMDTGELVVSVRKQVIDNDQEITRKDIKLKDARKLLKDRTIQVGDDVIVPIEPEEFGRIAAQSARQIVIQHLRDAERNKVFTEYKDKIGQVVTGIVQRFERRDMIVNIGKVEAVLPATEMAAGSKYNFNDRIKVIIIRVDLTPRGPQIIVSRKAPQLVVELFKQEVPEIADGTVQIIGIAREAGVRMKIAVKSTNSDVDPVGACVGMKGSRVQMVVRELENEKIDIVPWHPDAKTYVSNALNPAKIVSIDLDEKTKMAHVMVAQGNLAIAIGRKGQNTKLAAKLTGYRLDIRSENEDELAYEEIQRRYLEDFLSQISGLTELGMEGLLRSSHNSVDKIARLEPNKLMPFTGDDEELAERMIQGAKEYLEALRQMEEDRRKNRDDDDAEEGEGQEGEVEAAGGDQDGEQAGGDADEGSESGEAGREAESEESAGGDAGASESVEAAEGEDVEGAEGGAGLSDKEGDEDSSGGVE